MELRLQAQASSIADEVSALIAVIRPILEDLLYGLKADVVAEVGGYPERVCRLSSRSHAPQLQRATRRLRGLPGGAPASSVHRAHSQATGEAPMLCERPTTTPGRRNPIQT